MKSDTDIAEIKGWHFFATVYSLTLMLTADDTVVWLSYNWLHFKPQTILCTTALFRELVRCQSKK